MNGLVGFVIGGFELTFRATGSMGLMMESAIGQGTAEALMEEQKQESDIESLGGEAVGVALPIALEQGMTLELAEVVTQLIQAV